MTKRTTLLWRCPNCVHDHIPDDCYTEYYCLTCGPIGGTINKCREVHQCDECCEDVEDCECKELITIEELKAEEALCNPCSRCGKKPTIAQDSCAGTPLPYIASPIEIQTGGVYSYDDKLKITVEKESTPIVLYPKFYAWCCEKRQFLTARNTPQLTREIWNLFNPVSCPDSCGQRLNPIVED